MAVSSIAKALLALGALLGAAALVPVGKAWAQSWASPKTDLHGDSLPIGATARLGTVRWRHDGGSMCLALSPDEKILLVGTGEGAVLLWDVATGRELRRFFTKLPSISSIAFTPDGKSALVSYFGGFRQWDVSSGRETPFAEQMPKKHHRLTIDPDGKRLYIAYAGGLEERDLKTLRLLRRFDDPPDKDVEVLAASGNGKYVATGGWDKLVRVWDRSTGQALHSLKGHAEAVKSLSFSPDGKTLASTSYDSTIRLWDSATGKEVRSWKAHERGGQALFYSPDGKTMASCGWDHFIHFWDAETGKEVRRIPASPSALIFSADGKTLVSDGFEGVVRWWDVASGEQRKPVACTMGPIGSIALLPDGKAVVSGCEDGVRVWEAATGKILRRLTGTEPRYSYWVAVSPDGRLAASPGFNDPALRIWEIASGKEVGTIEVKKENPIYGLCFSPDNKTLATADYAGNIEVRNVASGKTVRRIEGRQRYIYSVRFSPDGKMIAGTCNENIRFWDANTGTELRQVETRGWRTSQIAFSPNNKLFAAVGGEAAPPYKAGYVRVWEADTGKDLRSLPGHEGQVSSLTFSPDSRTLATGGGPDKTIRLWELATGKERTRLQGHTGGVLSLSYSPDGRRLVSGSGDTTALVWDLTGQETRGRKAGILSNVELEGLWSDLANEDASKAWQAIWTLALAPESSVPYLGGHLQPVPPADKDKIARSIADLDSEDFAARRDAARQLEAVAELAEPALRKALEANSTEELRRQATRLLEKLTSLSQERLRQLRAVEALEYANTPAARKVLGELAQGALEARLTREAKASLDRLEGRVK
jgi:WD40 repeat protein